METFTFNFKNISRDLPVFEVGGGVKIAYLDTLSDYELVTALSRDIAALICGNRRYQESERVVLFTAENKGVPFAYAVARELCEKNPEKTFETVIARKHKKKFFGNCVYAEKTSITAERESEKLFVTEADAKKLENGSLVLVDDFYSTGASMNALETLARQCNADIIEKAVAIWEVADRNNKPGVKYVATLPVL